MLENKGEELDNKIEELKQQKKELLLEEGEAYRCNKCGETAIKSKPANRNEKEGLCYDCWCEKVQVRKREELMQTFKDAKIIDIVPESNPYSDINDVEKIILEVKGKRYEVVSAGYDEHYIEIRE